MQIRAESGPQLLQILSIEQFILKQTLYVTLTPGKTEVFSVVSQV